MVRAVVKVTESGEVGTGFVHGSRCAARCNPFSIYFKRGALSNSAGLQRRQSQNSYGCFVPTTNLAKCDGFLMT